MAPAIPWIVKGGIAIAGHYANKRAANKASSRGGEEELARTGAQGAAGRLGRQGEQAFDTGFGQGYEPAMGYFRSLARGGNAAQVATAGPRAQITDAYRGANTALDKNLMDPAQKAQAQAGNARDVAAQVSRLTAGVQPMAYSQLANMGMQGMELGGRSTAQSGGLYGGLLQQGSDDRHKGNEEQRQSGSAFGGLFRDLMGGLNFGGSGNSGGGIWEGGQGLPGTNRGMPPPPPRMGAGAARGGFRGGGF